MAAKEGLNLSPRSIVIIVAGIVLGVSSAGGLGVTLSKGASAQATEEIRSLIEATIEERESTMTQDEAETWYAERNRIRTVNATLKEHGAALEQLQVDIGKVQDTVDAIADKIDAN